MFQWNVEDMALLNQKVVMFIGKEKIYNCESHILREDKIAFVDSMQDGKLSYLLSLIDKFNQDKEILPKDSWGYVKTVSLKAWIKRNDTKYDRPLIDDWYYHGSYQLLGLTRHITYDSNIKGTWDTYDDLVDEIFHRQLKECERKEKEYFLAHDEYSILKKKLRDKDKCYHTTFGVHVGYCSNGDIYIYNEDHDKERLITIEELKDLLAKYEQLDALIEKLTAETNIVY